MMTTSNAVFSSRCTPRLSPDFIDVACSMARVGQAIVTMPFDTARAQYVHAVRCGLIERSMLASHAFERRLGTLEQLTCGPFARSI
jgi:hypothetical protein